MRIEAGVVVVVAVFGGCKEKEGREAAESQRGLEGPCAAEREAAAQAWDRVSSDIADMREGVIKENVSLELNEHFKLTHALVNSPECAGLIGLFDNLVAAKDKPRWQKCNEDSQRLNREEDDMRRLMHDKAGLRARQDASAKEARDIAARYRQGPVSEADAKRVYDRLLVYYGAASRVQSAGPNCIAGDCISTPAAAMIQYDIRPAEVAMRAASAACPKVADTMVPATTSPATTVLATAEPAAQAAPAATQPRAGVPTDLDEEQGSGESCTPRLVLDPDPKGTGGNLRAEPSRDGYLLTEVPNCTEVCEINAEGDWRHVRASPRDDGYMHRSQLVELGAARCAQGGAPTAKPAAKPAPKHTGEKPVKPAPPPPPAETNPFD